jgi:hypothetical protein
MKPITLDPNANYLLQTATDTPVPEWRKSLGSFEKETKGLGQGLYALGAQAIGATDARDEALAGYQQNMEEAQSGWMKPTVPKVEDIKFSEPGGLSRLGDYAANQVPKGLAQLGAFALTGGIGGGIAKLTAGAAIKDLAAKEVVNIAAELTAKRAGQTVVADAATRAAGKAAIESLAKRQVTGITAGVGTAGIGAEQGSFYGQMATDPTIGPEKAFAPAVIAGGISGATEIIPFHAFGKALGAEDWFKGPLKQLLKTDPELAARAKELAAQSKLVKAARVGGAALAGGAVEGVQEGVQQLIQQSAERYAKENSDWTNPVPKTPEEWSQLKNSMAPAFLTGMIPGAGAGAVRVLNTPKEPSAEDLGIALPATSKLAPMETIIGQPAPDSKDWLPQHRQEDQNQVYETFVSKDRKWLMQKFTTEGGVKQYIKPLEAQDAEQSQAAQTAAGAQRAATGTTNEQAEIINVQPNEAGTWDVVTPTGVVAEAVPTRAEAEQIRDEEFVLRTASEQPGGVGTPGVAAADAGAKGIGAAQPGAVEGELSATQGDLTQRGQDSSDELAPHTDNVTPLPVLPQSVIAPLQAWAAAGGSTEHASLVAQLRANKDFGVTDVQRSEMLKALPPKAAEFFAAKQGNPKTQAALDRNLAAAYLQNTMFTEPKAGVAHPDATTLEGVQKAAAGRKLGVVQPSGDVKYGEPNWRSTTLEAIQSLRQPRASGQQWLNMLTRQELGGKLVGKLPGVKVEEMEDMGLVDWLQGQEQVTKAELEQFAKGGGVRVEEVVHGTNALLPQGHSAEVVEDEDNGTWAIWDEAEGENIQSGIATEEEANAILRGMEKETTTKFAKYQVPGGSNYRELLITIPLGKKARVLNPNEKQEARDAEALRVFDVSFDDLSPEEQEEIDDSLNFAIGQAPIVGESVYRSSHWNEPNVLGHLRFNERTDVNGKRVLFVEEVQSDWHQEGRKNGYLLNSEEAKNRRNLLSLKLERNEITLDEYELELSKTGGVPTAPMKSTSTWAMLGMKRAIKWAADNGFDRVAWAPGEVQAERYDLSKQIDSVDWTGTGDRLLWSAMKGRKVVLGGNMEEAAASLGKEIAQKLADTTEESGSLRGLDLKVGGEGMRGFYDKLLPNEVSKWAKKFGGKVGVTEIPTLVQPQDDQGIIRGVSPIDSMQKVWSLDLTPTMRTEAQRGMPLYAEQQGQGASTREALQSAAQSILGTTDNWRVHIFATPEEAAVAGIPAERLGGSSGRGAYGWVESRNGKLHATLIASRIPAGGEMAALLHELGAHIGLESVLTKVQLATLVRQIKAWATHSRDAVEVQAAKAALQRVESAKTPEADQDAELIAYFVEESVKRGIDPTALQADTAVGRWFRTLWSAFKRALRRLRVANIDKLTAQDVVDLAYGAARLELSGHWHGSADAFRKFDSQYMSSGAGDQWYSWGHYVAKRKGIGEHYREMVRKQEGIFVDDVALIDALDLSDQSPKGRALAEVFAASAYTQDKNELLQRAITALENWDNKEAITWLQKNKNSIQVRGSQLHRVDVNVRPDETMHWDKPLSEQPQGVKDAIEKQLEWYTFEDDSDLGPIEVPSIHGKGSARLTIPGIGDVALPENWEEITGQELYQRMVAVEKQGVADQWQQYGRVSSRAASMFLDSIGIKGMEHWDEPSRKNINKVLLDKTGKIFTPKLELGVSGALIAVQEAGSIDAALNIDAVKNNSKVLQTLNRWKNTGVHFDYSPGLSTNLVVFNDRNIYTVGRAPAGDLSQVRYGMVADTFNAAQDYFLGSTPSDLGKAHQFRIWLQDRFYPQKRREEQVSAQEVARGAAPITAEQSYYVAQNKIRSKVKMRTDALWLTYVTPMQQIAARREWYIKTLDKATYAHTAEETNDRGRRLTAKLWLNHFKNSMSDPVQRKALNHDIERVKKQTQSTVTLTNGTQVQRVDKLARQIAMHALARQWAARDAQLVAALNAGQATPLHPTSIDPELVMRFTDFDEKPSGMTDAEAQKELAKWNTDADMQNLFSIFDAMNRVSLADRLNDGLLTQEMHDKWFGAHQHYATLRREGYEDLKPKRGGGAGGAGKLREFSPKPAVDVFSNTVQTAVRAIAQGENNKAKNVLKAMVEAYPDPKFWRVIKKKQTKHLDADGFLEAGFTDDTSPNEIAVLTDGEPWIIEMAPDNEMAREIATAARAEDEPALGPVLMGFAYVTRMMAQLNTSLNPEFFLTNQIRDFLEAQINMSDSEADAIRNNVVKELPGVWGALREIYRDRTLNKNLVQRTDPVTGKFEADIFGHSMIGIVKRYEAAGVPSGWMSYYERAADQAKDLDAQINNLKDRASFRKYAHNAKRWIEDYNTIAENAIRLSTFKALVEIKNSRGNQAVSDARAAEIAKDLTVNFDRRGSGGVAINSLFMFANAGIQGSARLLHAMIKNRKVQKIALGIVAFSALVDMLNAASSDDWDKIQKDTKRRNLIFANPTGVGPEFVKLPAPWGYNVLWRLGQQLSMMWRQPRGWTAGGAAGDLVQTTLGAFNPIEGGTLAQMITPTLLRPAIAIAENKDWTGERPMRPSVFPGEVKPDSQLFWGSTNPISKAVAEGLNALTGGDKVTPGWANFSPTTFDAWASQIFGATGKLVADSAGIAINLTDPAKEFEPSRLPVLRKFSTGPSSAMDSAMYHDRVSQVMTLEHRLKAYTEGPYADREKAREVRAESAALLGLVPHAKEAEKQLRSLRKRSTLAQSQGRGEQAAVLRGQMKQIMQRFNGSFDKRVQ